MGGTIDTPPKSFENPYYMIVKYQKKKNTPIFFSLSSIYMHSYIFLLKFQDNTLQYLELLPPTNLKVISKLNHLV